MHLETVGGSWDWKGFFATIEDVLVLAGLVSTHEEPHIAHSWRLVRRIATASSEAQSLCELKCCII